VCCVIVEQGGFNLAWIGQIEPDNRLILPVASAGIAKDYTNGIVVSADEGRPEGRGPTGMCIRELKPVVQNDFINDPNTKLCHEKARIYGFRGTAAFPYYSEAMYGAH
jgi:two-component system sensor histidine kinase/response regulator